MSMNTVDQFTRHVKRTFLVIHVSAGRTKTRFTAERNEFQFATIRACKECTAIRRITTMNHLGDVLNLSLTGMKFVKDMLIIIDKNVL